MKILHPERYEKWSETMRDWESTGLSVAEYCRRNEINRSLFFAWKRRLKDRDSEEVDAGFVALEFQSEGVGCGVSVGVGDGVRLHLEKGFDEGELVRAVRVLRSGSC